MDVHEIYGREISNAVAKARRRINLSAIGYEPEDLTQDATLALLEAEPTTSKETYAALDAWYVALCENAYNSEEFWSEQLPDTEDYL